MPNKSITAKDYRNISALFNWASNPRAIKKDKFEELKKRITKRGQIKPLIITPDGEVLGGNMRLRAMQELGIKEAWVSVVTPTSEADKIEIALTDNEEMGYYEDQALAELIAQYKDEIDLSKYSVHLKEPQTLEEILKQFSPDEVVEDEVPEVQEEVVSQLGEVYQLGRHYVMCGDSTKVEDVERLMDGKKADMVFTDPPYGVDYSGGIQFTKDGVKKNQRDRLADDHKTTDIYSRVVPIIPHFTKGAVYMWFADTQALPVYQAVEKVGDIHALIIWVKNGGYSAMNANYKQKHEPCLYWKPKGGKLNFTGASTETTIWELNKDGVNEYHPTQKPIALCAKAIQNHEAKTVLDLFLGSGSTLIACEQTNRTCYGMELDPKYVDVIRKRYAKFIDPENWEDNWQSMTPVTMK